MKLKISVLNKNYDNEIPHSGLHILLDVRIQVNKKQVSNAIGKFSPFDETTTFPLTYVSGEEELNVRQPFAW
jgi:hypothetical protein